MSLVLNMKLGSRRPFPSSIHTLKVSLCAMGVTSDYFFTLKYKLLDVGIFVGGGGVQS